jgi:signal transduction histidine kinase
MDMRRKETRAGFALAAMVLLASVLAIGSWMGSDFRSGLSWLLFSLGTALSGLSLAALAGKKWTRPESSHAGQAPVSGVGARTLQNMLVVQAGAMEEKPGQAALINHEIRNHLCTLKGSARLLRQRISGNEHKAIIDRIDHVVERLESFAAEAEKRDSGPAARVAPIRLGDSARAVAKTHFSQAETQFRWDFGHDSEPFLGCPARLEQVFQNLYLNAIEAGALNVTTSVRTYGNRMVVSVEDDGSGCQAADLDRIFEPFFSTKQGSGRRGLGMVIVRSIVESLRGSIKVRSKNHLGRGSHGLVFHLEFPVMKEGTPSGHPPFPPLKAGTASVGDPLSRNWLLTLPEPI